MALQFFLFILTVISTLVAGAFQKGINIFEEPWRIWEGFPFSVSIMAILLTHELSHYFASKKHRINVTLPYFIPAPSIIGTFGAFIKMKSPIVTRKALIDIGASGPIGGFLIALLVTIYGLTKSEMILIEHRGIALGDSILFSFLCKLIVGTPPEGKDILLHPIAFAGWIGFFVTSMNLLPIGQLDGGHIAYALFGKEKHKKISLTLIILLTVVGLSKFYLYNDYFVGKIFDILRENFWEGWAIWAFLLFILGFNHPSVIHWEVHLSKDRKVIGWIAMIIFFLTFIPVPFKIN